MSKRSVFSSRSSTRSSAGADAPTGPDFGTFDARLLGSTTVREATNASMVVQATAEIKKQKTPEKKISLDITTHELKVTDKATNEVIQTSEVGQVIFFSINPKDKKIICYTTKSKYGVLHAHVFVVKEKAKEVQAAIKAAMEANNAENPMGSAAVDTSSARAAASADLMAFDAFYLGSQNVTESRGNNIVDQAIERNEVKLKDIAKRQGIRKVLKAESAGDAVTLVLTPESIRTVERLSGDTIMNDFIKNVTFSKTSDRNGQDVFAYIYNEERHQSTTCHIFIVTEAKIIRKTLKEMVQISTENSKLQGNSPFAALPNAPREVPKGELFKKQIHRADLKAINVIGAGQYGEVYLALQTARKPSHLGGGLITVKRAVKMVRNNATKEDRVEFLRESETQLKLDHENLVKIVGVAVQQAPWLCVLEFCEHADLRAVVKACREKNITIGADEQLSFCQQLAGGMAHLTAKRLVHMDLAARNCLLAHGNVVKVADFGLTRPLDPGKSTLTLRERLRLPLKWVSIEGLEEKIFGEYSDCWSFGILMWEILTYGETPYATIRTQNIQEKIRDGERLEMPAATPQQFWNIIKKCWNTNPEARWKFSNLQLALRDLIPTCEETPTRDIGVFLRSGGKDSGIGSGIKVMSPRDLIQTPSEASKLKDMDVPILPYKTSANQNPSVRGTPQQALAKMRAHAARQAQPNPSPQPVASHVASPSPAPVPAARPSPSPRSLSQRGTQISTGRPSIPQPAARPRPSASTTSVSSPSANDVDTGELENVPEPSEILHTLGLSQYNSNLQRDSITKYMFINCDGDMLGAIGITNPNHKQAILEQLRLIQIELKREKVRKLRELASQRRDLAPKLEDENPEVRQSARGSISQLQAKSSAADAWKTANDAQIAERQKKIAEVKEKRNQNEEQETTRRMSAVAANMNEAMKIAKQKEEERKSAKAEAEHKLKEAKEAAKMKKAEEETTRLQHLKKAQEEKKALEEKAAKFEVSEMTEKLVQPKQTTSANLFAVAPEDDEWGKGKSKIWKALNPRPLAYQTPRQRAEAEEAKIITTSTAATGHDYTFLNGVREEGIAPVADDIPTSPDPEEDVLDGFGDDDNEDGVHEIANRQEAEEEEEEEVEEDDVNPDDVADLDDAFMKQMAINRAKREKEEEERKAKLKDEYDKEQKKKQAELDKELAIIAAQKAIADKEKEAQRDRDVEEAKARMATELNFDFSWG